jgi:hypothetical protein
MSRKLLTLTLLVLMTACANDAPAPLQPMVLDFAKLGKINLAVAHLSYMNNAPRPPTKDVAVFQNYKPQLSDALYRWGVDRLQASGTQGQATLVIHDADLRRDTLPLKTGIDSWFTRQQSERWSGKVTVDLRIEGAASNFAGNASTTVTRSTTLPEDANAAERENAYRRLLRSMMEDLNTQMERAMRDHLNSVILTMP